MKKNLIYLLAILFVGCQDQYDICDKPRTVNMHAGFYQVTGGTENIAFADTFSISLLDGSTGIYNQVVHVSKFNFPLNPLVNSASYYIKLSNSLPGDTINIAYSSQNINISAECGNVDIHTLSGAWSTLHSIDSVKVINPAISTSITENLKIYF
jgi:hypothetical protein